VAQSLILEGDFDLDEYVERGTIEPDNYRVLQIGEHTYSSFPLGTSLLVVFPLALHRMVPILGPDVRELSPVFEMLVASAIVSLCAAVIYGIGRILLDRLWSSFLAGIFALCTSAWSTASRALWQHGPSMLMLSVALCIVLLAEKRPKWIVWAGLPLAYAYVIRPTNSISALCLSVYVLVRHRKHIFAFLGMAAAVGVPFLILNLAVYRAVLPPYYLPSRLGTNKAFFEAMAANLVSPARGLFVYSPVFFVSVVGVFLKIRDRKLDRLDVALLVILLLHLVTISSFQHWWGGHSFGPRFFCDMVPYLTYLTGTAIARLPGHGGRARIAYAFCFAVLVEASVFAHSRGALSQATYDWNREPVNVDRDPSRVWDWQDPQFMRGLLLNPVAIPDQAYAMLHSRDQGEYKIWMELVNPSQKPFRWRGSAPVGFALSPLEGAGAARYSLSVTVSEPGYSPGRYSMGTIQIQTLPDGFLRQPKTLSVPVELRIVEGDRKVFLPLALRESIADR